MSELYKNYKKPELLEIMAELDMNVATFKDATSRAMVSAIVSDMESHGIPDEEECSDLLNRFIEDWESEDEEEESQPEPKVVEAAITSDEEVVTELPDCYTMADERDPACRRCKVFESCMKERIEIRESDLPCFGKLFDITAEECKLCLEAGPCRAKLHGS